MVPLLIDSPKNPRFRMWREVAHGDVARHRRTLAMGSKLVHELAPKVAAKATWLIPEGFGGALPEIAGRPIRLASQLFKEIDTAGTHYPILDIEIDDLKPAESLSGNLYLCLPLQDPANFGALVRSAAGLGAAGILAMPGSCHPFHPKAVRSSSGAVFMIEIFRLTAGISLKSLGLEPVLLDASGMRIDSFEFPSRCALVVGQEGPGLSTVVSGLDQDHTNQLRVNTLALPMEKIESYNAAVAASIVLYEWKRRHLT